MDNEDLNVAYGCLTAGSLALALYGTAYLGWKAYHYYHVVGGGQ